MPLIRHVIVPNSTSRNGERPSGYPHSWISAQCRQLRPHSNEAGRCRLPGNQLRSARFGRSGQPWQSYNWDTYSDDLADVMQATGATEDVAVIGYSMGGGEAARYMSRHGGKGVIKIGLYASVVPGMLQAADNPAGHTPADYEDIVTGIEKDAAAFYRHTFLPPFYGKGIITQQPDHLESSALD